LARKARAPSNDICHGREGLISDKRVACSFEIDHIMRVKLSEPEGDVGFEPALAHTDLARETDDRGLPLFEGPREESTDLFDDLIATYRRGLNLESSTGGVKIGSFCAP
jgi:hypothetical protein